MAVLGGALAAVGGRLDWSNLPILIAAAALFLASGARVASNPSTRLLDLCVLGALGLLALQLVPLPAGLVGALSPNAPTLQDIIALEPAGGWRSLSIHPAATRGALATALAAALLFWSTVVITASTSPARLVVGGLAWLGIATALVAVAQHITAPTLIYWRWEPQDPGARPFGPFISRNHLATWVVLSVSVVVAALIARVRGRLSARMTSGPRAALVAVLEGNGVTMLAAIVLMLVALGTTLSRAGMVALAASAAAGAALSGRRGERGPGPLIAASAAAVVMLAVAAWTNGEGLAQRVVSTLDSGDGSVSRVTIWRETWSIARDYLATGVGGGAFGDAMLQYQRTTTRILFNHAHNEYLQLVTEGGIPLLIIVAAGLVVLARIAARRMADDPSERRWLRLGACAGFVGIAVQSIWEVGLRTPVNLLLAAVLAGMVVAPTRRDAEDDAPDAATGV